MTIKRLNRGDTTPIEMGNLRVGDHFVPPNGSRTFVVEMTRPLSDDDVLIDARMCDPPPGMGERWIMVGRRTDCVRIQPWKC